MPKVCDNDPETKIYISDNFPSAGHIPNFPRFEFIFEKGPEKQRLHRLSYDDLCELERMIVKAKSYSIWKTPKNDKA